MKSFFIIASILVCSFKLYAQHEKDDLRKMVDSTINMKYVQVIATDKRGNIGSYFDNLYLINEQNQPLDYVPVYNNLKLKQINIYNKENRKVLKKGINAWKVLTVLNRNMLEVKIIDFHITYKNNSYHFSNGGGTIAIFEFSCDEGKWKLSSFRNRGI